MRTLGSVLSVATYLAGFAAVSCAKPLVYETVSVLSSAPLTTKRVHLFDAGYGGSCAGYAILNPHVHLGCRLAVDYWFYHGYDIYGRKVQGECHTIESASLSARLVRTTFGHKGTWPTRGFIEVGAGLFHFARVEGGVFSKALEQSWRGGFNVGAGVQLGGRRSLWFEFVPMFHLVQSPANQPYHYFSAHAGVLLGRTM